MAAPRATPVPAGEGQSRAGSAAHLTCPMGQATLQPKRDPPRPRSAPLGAAPPEMSLTSLIVERGIASSREVEEALARQILYGGDFITNLFEVAAVEEAAVVSALADTLGLPPAPPGELPRVPAAAARLLTAEVVAERALAPIELGDALVVAVAEPIPLEVEQELTFALALPIDQRVAPRFRIQQALARDYGVPLDDRTARLLGALGQRGRLGAITSPPPPPYRALPRPPSVIPAPLLGNQPGERLGERTLVKGGEALPLQRPRRWRDLLTEELAREELESATDRDEILDALFEFSRQSFDYTALFMVHGAVAKGRDGAGDGAAREKVARMSVPLETRSMLAAGWAARRLVRAVPSSAGVDAVLVSDLGRPGGTEWAVVPVVLRGRVVALLFGDGGASGMDEIGVHQIERLAESASGAFERVIVRRKLQAGDIPEERPVAVSRPPRVADPRAASRREPVDRPAVEELATPIHDLSIGAVRSRREGPVAAPPERAPSAAPAAPAVSAAPASAAAAPARRSTAGPPRRRTSSTWQRAQAPVLEFGRPSVPSVTTEAASIGRLGVPPLPVEAASCELAGAEDGAIEVTATDLDATPLAAPVVYADPDATPVAPAVEPVLELAQRKGAPPAVRSSRRMPASEQQVSVPAHKPPSPWRDHARVLPSVIVDDAEYGALVERVLAEPDDEAEASLLRAGASAMPALMARFPGPTTIDQARLQTSELPRVAECGPILRLVASQRRTALGAVLERLEDEDAAVRFWATYLLTELVYPEAIDPVIERVFDEDEQVRRAARTALRALADSDPEPVIERLAVLATAESPYRRGAIEALAATRAALAVSALLPLLDDPSAEIADAARGALVTLSRQDFGADDERWRAWWASRREQHRVEWLIDALMAEDRELRAEASEELMSVSKEHFGYYDDLPKRERQRAQARYRKWWEEAGRLRFSRASTRRA